MDVLRFGDPLAYVVALPDHVVIVDVVSGLTMVLLYFLFLQGNRFGFGIKLFVAEILGPFQWDIGAVGPVALQVGLAVGRARESPALGGLTCAGSAACISRAAAKTDSTQAWNRRRIGVLLASKANWASLKIISFWECERYGAGR